MKAKERDALNKRACVFSDRMGARTGIQNYPCPHCLTAFARIEIDRESRRARVELRRAKRERQGATKR
jgi:hypothetical protein